MDSPTCLYMRDDKIEDPVLTVWCRDNCPIERPGGKQGDFFEGISFDYGYSGSNPVRCNIFSEITGRTRVLISIAMTIPPLEATGMA